LVQSLQQFLVIEKSSSVPWLAKLRQFGKNTIKVITGPSTPHSAICSLKSITRRFAVSNINLLLLFCDDYC
jgi:hypothetical protein